MFVALVVLQIPTLDGVESWRIILSELFEDGQTCWHRSLSPARAAGAAPPAAALVGAPRRSGVIARWIAMDYWRQRVATAWAAN